MERCPPHSQPGQAPSLPRTCPTLALSVLGTLRGRPAPGRLDVHSFARWAGLKDRTPHRQCMGTFSAFIVKRPASRGQPLPSLPTASGPPQRPAELSPGLEPILSGSCSALWWPQKAFPPSLLYGSSQADDPLLEMLQKRQRTAHPARGSTEGHRPECWSLSRRKRSQRCPWSLRGTATRTPHAPALLPGVWG